MRLRKLPYILIVLLILILGCAGKSVQPFTFVQLCDPQLGMGGYDHDVETLERAVTRINRLKPDFVVICGDLVHHVSDSAYADLKVALAGLHMPWHAAPGNHDVGQVPTDTTLAKYRQTIGEDYFHFTHHGVLFIVVNTQLWKADVKDESDRHDLWFERTLNARNDRPVVVVGHHPLYSDSLDEEERYANLPLSRRTALFSLFEENNVRAYLTGHQHRLIVNEYEGIQLVTGESTSKNFDKRPMGFRLWTVSRDTLFHRFVEVVTY